MVGKSGKRLDGEDETFARIVERFSYLFPEFGEVWSVDSQISTSFVSILGKVLVSEQERCKLCTKVLAVDPNAHVVVIYHEHRGTHLRSRVLLMSNRVEST